MTIEEMRIRKKELGYSYEQISELSGVPFGTVQRVLGGYTQSPRYATLRALERALWPEKFGKTGTYDEAAESISDEARELSATYGAVQPVFGSESKNQGEFTVEDWESLPEDERWELIDGTLYDMAEPTVEHQIIVSQLAFALTSHIMKNGGKCMVFSASPGVRLNSDNRTMIVPDITVVCDKRKVLRKWLNGAPDLVVEVMSPSRRRYDSIIKLQKYASAKVREFWLVDPKLRKVKVYNFMEADSDPGEYSFTDLIPVAIWDGECKVDFSLIDSEISRWSPEEKEE